MVYLLHFLRQSHFLEFVRVDTHFILLRNPFCLKGRGLFFCGKNTWRG